VQILLFMVLLHSIKSLMDVCGRDWVCWSSVILQNRKERVSLFAGSITQGVIDPYHPK
jgi:hypothetical protein